MDSAHHPDGDGPDDDASDAVKIAYDATAIREGGSRLPCGVRRASACLGGSLYCNSGGHSMAGAPPTNCSSRSLDAGWGRSRGCSGLGAFRRFGSSTWAKLCSGNCLPSGAVMKLGTISGARGRARAGGVGGEGGEGEGDGPGITAWGSNHSCRIVTGVAESSTLGYAAQKIGAFWCAGLARTEAGRLCGLVRLDCRTFHTNFTFYQYWAVL